MVRPPLRSSQAALAQHPSPKSTATTSPDLHRRLWGPVSQVDPTAALPAPQVPSAITALQVPPVLVAVPVNVTVSLAKGIASNSIAEVHVVATVTIQALVVPLILRLNTLLEALGGTDLLSDDDLSYFGTRKEAFWHLIRYSYSEFAK